MYSQVLVLLLVSLVGNAKFIPRRSYNAKSKAVNEVVSEATPKLNYFKEEVGEIIQDLSYLLKSIDSHLTNISSIADTSVDAAIADLEFIIIEDEKKETSKEQAKKCVNKIKENVDSTLDEYDNAIKSCLDAAGTRLKHFRKQAKSVVVSAKITQMRANGIIGNCVRLYNVPWKVNELKNCLEVKIEDLQKEKKKIDSVTPKEHFKNVTSEVEQCTKDVLDVTLEDVSTQHETYLTCMRGQGNELSDDIENTPKPTRFTTLSTTTKPRPTVTFQRSTTVRKPVKGFPYTKSTTTSPSESTKTERPKEEERTTTTIPLSTGKDLLGTSGVTVNLSSYSTSTVHEYSSEQVTENSVSTASTLLDETLKEVTQEESSSTTNILRTTLNTVSQEGTKVSTTIDPTLGSTYVSIKEEQITEEGSTTLAIKIEDISTLRTESIEYSTNTPESTTVYNTPERTTVYNTPESTTVYNTPESTTVYNTPESTTVYNTPESKTVYNIPESTTVNIINTTDKDDGYANTVTIQETTTPTPNVTDRKNGTIFQFFTIKVNVVGDVTDSPFIRNTKFNPTDTSKDKLSEKKTTKTETQKVESSSPQVGAKHLNLDISSEEQ